MIRPIPVRIESVEEHGALVTMSMQEYRTVDEQAAFLIVDGLRRYGYLPRRSMPPRSEHADSYVGVV